ncbi:MAG: PHP domain-containing protein [Gammaproteobacteria bacterium]|jgi:hypothetical protein|nr:PHP domain-containing protein [Gammaproteobacteria bacterium]MDP6617704.1 PHP domain-containing protein [Gammaproteobacteria bacterium]MDP6695687.1 PHP domain-containing protein [Gammaproteobacteria bacterium]MDP7042007.1 PHP domain-containing protein [Gammaproteobacteria bacterium]
MKVDLHTHSTASDGELSPDDLLQHAGEAGVGLLAITDHDTLDGYTKLCAGKSDCGVVAGIELSTNWRSLGIHVVGLNVSPDNPVLLEGIRQQRQARAERAATIAKKLEKAGFPGTLPEAQRIAGESILGRPHFATHLVETGQVKDIQTAFRKYLGRGKIGDVRETWAPLSDIIAWITEAGGQAILAHPAKYRLTNLKLAELARDFRDLGGHGIEVISGRQDSALTRRLASLAGRHDLLASVGSDFHQYGSHNAGPGEVDRLPGSCNPVWEAW